MANRTLAALFLGALAHTVSHAQAVHVVDASNGPGTDFKSLPSAVTFAKSGDVLLVRGGTYAPVVVTAKALSIVADRGARVTVADSVRVESLAAHQHVLLSGLTILSPEYAQGLAVEDCAGTVWLESCDLVGDSPDLLGGGAFVANSASVVLSRTTVAPSSGGSDGRPAVLAVNSNVFAFDCVLLGGEGRDEAPFTTAGAAAVSLFDSGFFASRSELSGGDGGDGLVSFFCSDGGAGGPGLDVGGAVGSGAVVLDSTVTGGLGGASGGPKCAAGQAGAPVLVRKGASLELVGRARLLRSETAVREGDELHEVFEGQPGDLAISIYSLDPVAGLIFPTVAGSVLLGGTPVPRIRGVLDATGRLTAATTVPELGLGIESMLIYQQALFIDAGGGKHLGSATASVVLDASL